VIRFRVFDRSNPIQVVSKDPNNPRSFSQADLIFEQMLSGSTTSFALPTSWTLPNGQSRSLAFNSQYSIDIALEHNRTDGSPVSAPRPISTLRQSTFRVSATSLCRVQHRFQPRLN
jgi:hypothetical protein